MDVKAKPRNPPAMTEFLRNNEQHDVHGTIDVPSVIVSAAQTIDWYSEGEAKTVEIGGFEVVVRFVGRKGRRARIAISAPAGVVFRDGGERQTKASDENRREES
jgi:hypothetical protein